LRSISIGPLLRYSSLSPYAAMSLNVCLRGPISRRLHARRPISSAVLFSNAWSVSSRLLAAFNARAIRYRSSALPWILASDALLSVIGRSYLHFRQKSRNKRCRYPYLYVFQFLLDLVYLGNGQFCFIYVW